jgi:hypothetical protein
MKGLAPGNHVIVRDNDEIAASVNVSFPKVITELEKRFSTLTTGKGYIKPLNHGTLGDQLGQIYGRR